MATILIRLLLLILILWILRRVLARMFSSSKPQEPEKNTAATPNNMVKDPVCGMYMDARLAIRLEERRESFYFCSEECKSKYLGKSNRGTGAHTAPPM